MRRTLLIGNGLNRCLSGGLSWGDLLRDIAAQYGVDYCAGIPLPMEFERLLNGILRNQPSDGLHDEIKKQIAARMADAVLPDGAVHHLIRDIRPDTVLTTNYDSLLKQVFAESYVFPAPAEPKYRKYLFAKTADLSGVCFYHLHGLAGMPSTLCLGYEHYMGIVQRLRSALNTRTAGRRDQMAIKQILFGETAPSDTWGERFYMDDMAIIGLGLSDCEADLWWLLTHRAYLYYTDDCGMKDKIQNRLVYYDVIDDLERRDPAAEQARLLRREVQRNRHCLLNGVHVAVRSYELSRFEGRYAAAYRQMLTDLRSDGFGG